MSAALLMPRVCTQSRQTAPRALLLQRRALASAPAKTTTKVSYLIIDGYIQTGREGLVAGGATTAGELYAQMFAKCTPAHLEVEYDLVFPSDPGFQPPDLSKYHAIGWSGSSQTVYKKDDERMQQCFDLATRCFALGIPQFGSCFGAQLAAATAGGTVAKNPMGKELGLARKIQLTDAGRAHPMYHGKKSFFDAVSSHNDEVTHLPPGALKLAQNAHTGVQAISVRYLKGEFWGVQYHPEYDLHELARLKYCRRQVNTTLGFFRDIEAADAHIADIEALHADPSRTDIAWRLGYDADVMDEDVRMCEVKNFIRYLVLPFKQAKDMEISV